MGIRNILASLTFASLATVAHAKHKQTDITDTSKETQGTTITSDELTMPDWIPVTSDGEFDKTSAYNKAKIFWKENGKDIQQFSNDVKAGADKHIAFKKVAKKLSKGDKEEEQQLLDLYNVIEQTLAEKNGNVKDTNRDKIAAIGTSAALGGLLAIMGGMICWPGLRYGEKFSTKRTLKHLSILTSPAILLPVFNTAIPLLTTKSETYMTEKIFVDIQERMYNEYKRQGFEPKKQYTMTDMKTAKMMIDMTKNLKSK